MIWPQLSHFSHKPSVRIFFSPSPVPSTPRFSRANHAMRFHFYSSVSLEPFARSWLGETAAGAALFLRSRPLLGTRLPHVRGEIVAMLESHLPVEPQCRFVGRGNSQADRT